MSYKDARKKVKMSKVKNRKAGDWDELVAKKHRKPGWNTRYTRITLRGLVNGMCHKPGMSPTMFKGSFLHRTQDQGKTALIKAYERIHSAFLDQADDVLGKSLVIDNVSFTRSHTIYWKVAKNKETWHTTTFNVVVGSD